MIEFAFFYPIKSGSDIIERCKISKYNLMETLDDKTICKIYLGFDHTDENDIFIKNIEDIFKDFQYDIKFYDENYKGKICYIWKDMANRAKGNHKYYLLLGDDVKILTDNWTERVKVLFNLQNNMGVVSFYDKNFPSISTFPIITEHHFKIFSTIFPDDFINQDADPYLGEIYKRFGLFNQDGSLILENMIGGNDDARYKKKHIEWKFNILNRAIDKISNNLQIASVPTIDIVVPTFRCDPKYLDLIINITIPKNRYTTIIIIVDSTDINKVKEIQTRYDYLSHVRVRINTKNKGACYSRNRGIDESTADWILFLDDDIIPESDVLEKYYESVDQIHNSNQKYDGIVGLTRMSPTMDTLFINALTSSYVTYFYDIANKKEHPGWGVTANVCYRRTAKKFNMKFAKTGGGEDIEFGIGKKLISCKNAIVHHPWWNNGDRITGYKHIMNWARSDGAIMDVHRDYTYKNLPNSAEIFVLSLILFIISFGKYNTFQIGLYLFFGEFIMKWLTYPRESIEYPKNTIKPLYDIICILEGTFIVYCLELARIWGHFSRFKFFNFCLRFDWHLKTDTNSINHERNTYYNIYSIAIFSYILIHFFI